jgi:hypothetical protein
MRKSTTTDMGETGEPAALTDKDLDAVTGGGTVDHSEFRIVKLLDAATPKLAGAPGGHIRVFSGLVADPA